MGNKTDLARSRLVKAEDSCSAAVMAGVKFVETSAGIGHMTDELLVGIVMQCRLVLRMFLASYSSSHSLCVFLLSLHLKTLAILSYIMTWKPYT